LNFGIFVISLFDLLLFERSGIQTFSAANLAVGRASADWLVAESKPFSR